MISDLINEYISNYHSESQNASSQSSVHKSPSGFDIHKNFEVEMSKEEMNRDRTIRIFKEMTFLNKKFTLGFIRDAHFIITTVWFTAQFEFYSISSPFY